MARLYAWVRSDTALNEKTIEANQRVEVQVNYGSAKKSLYVGELLVTWNIGDEKPSVRLFLASGIEYEVSHVN